MKKPTCEQVIDNINGYLMANRTGEKINKDSKFYISIIAGFVDAINQCIEKDADERR